MSTTWDEPWTDGDSFPWVTKYQYTAEKVTLAGSLIGSILYGLLILLSFQCMAALLKPAHRGEEGIKQWPIFYTMAMFSFVTVYTAANLYILSISFIDHRKNNYIYEDHGFIRISGPLGYQMAIHGTILGLVPNIMFNLNNWLADGLLIYRCYIIYSTSLWTIVLPCLMYLASLGMGIVAIYFQLHLFPFTTSSGLTKFGVPYLSISVALNVLLTLMIVVRLVLHSRNIRTATGALAGTSGLYKTISTIFIESCALFTMSSLLVVGGLAAAAYSSTPNIWIIGDFVVDIFFPVLAEVQVIAPLLIIQRIANGSALTGHTITTGRTSLFNVRNRGELADSEYVPFSGHPTSSAAGYRKNPGEPGVVVERTTGFHPDGKV